MPIDHSRCIPGSGSSKGHTHEGERGFWEFAADIDEWALQEKDAMGWLTTHSVGPIEAEAILEDAIKATRVIIFGGAIQVTYDHGLHVYRICEYHEAMP